jgi:sec-independent protein translocase protein TatC
MRLLPRRLAHDEQAGLVHHLDELRSRLLVCLIAIACSFALSYAFHPTLLHWLNKPLRHGLKPVTFGVTEAFTTSVTVSLWAAAALALPIICWQLWAFLAPAVDQAVERALAWFVAFAASLLTAGVAFGYFIVLPAAIHFLTTYDHQLYTIQIRASSYYSFVLLVLATCAIVFELPIFVLALTRLRILPTSKLRKNRRLGYVIVAAIAVALPGVDPVTTILEMAPLLILFEASIWLAVLFERRWLAHQATGEFALEPNTR